MQAGTPLRRGWPRRRGETVAGRGADADGWGLPGRDATGRGVPLRNGRARRGAEVSGRGFRQASARLATACTPGQPGAWLASGFTIARRVELALDEQMHDGQADAGLLLFGWCAEGIHLVYDLCWDAEDSVQLFVCGGVVVAEEPYYCNELVVGYLTEWLVVSLV